MNFTVEDTETVIRQKIKKNALKEVNRIRKRGGRAL